MLLLVPICYAILRKRIDAALQKLLNGIPVDHSVDSIKSQIMNQQLMCSKCSGEEQLFLFSDEDVKTKHRQ